MSNPSRLNKALLIVLLSVGLAAVSCPAMAKIYKWVDENGKVHFTDNLSKIPPQYRENNKVRTMKEVPGEASDPVKLRLPEKKLKEYVIALKPIPGGNYVVETLLNGKVRAELVVDTGASMVILSSRIAEKLGVRDGPHMPKLNFSTAGGMVESPLIILKKVEVGSARVHNVEASVNPNMGMLDGLLGMSFLGAFKVEVENDKDQLVLRPLSRRGDKLWDGQNAEWWKSKFDNYTQMIRHYQRVEDMTKNDPKQHREAAKLARYFQELHSALDKRADRAGLPKEYRSYP